MEIVNTAFAIKRSFVMIITGRGNLWIVLQVRRFYAAWVIDYSIGEFVSRCIIDCRL